MNRKNLEKLASYLESDELQAAFDMRYFMTNDESEEYLLQAYDGQLPNGWECGTICCALGHAPYATGIPKSEHSYGWDYYCYKVFGIDIYDIEWSWLFNKKWASVDNTPKGAAWRVRYLLAGRLAPLDLLQDNRINISALPLDYPFPTSNTTSHE